MCGTIPSLTQSEIPSTHTPPPALSPISSQQRGGIRRGKANQPPPPSPKRNEVAQKLRYAKHRAGEANSFRHAFFVVVAYEKRPPTSDTLDTPFPETKGEGPKGGKPKGNTGAAKA